MPLEPTLAEVIRETIRADRLELHTALPGRIKSYDATTQTAEVIPVVRGAVPKRDGSIELEDLPVIPNVPIAWPRGGGFYLHFPLEPGDHVLLVFSEAAIGQWRETGELSEPGDLARHDLSYAFAVPGIAPTAGKFSDAPSSGEAVIGVGGGGVLRVSTSGGMGSSQFVTLAQKLKAALATAAGAGEAAGTGGGGSGAAAFKAFAGAINAWTDATIGATTLKAE